MTTHSDALATAAGQYDLIVSLANDRGEQITALTEALHALTDEFDAYRKSHPDPMLVGAAVGGNSDPSALEAALGHPLAVRRTYFGSSSAAANTALTTVVADQAKGRIPFISFKLPWGWPDMAAGRGDAWCKNRADRLAATGRPVKLVLHHEPEGDGDPAAWVAMQRRCLPIFAAPNVTPGICLTGYPQTTNPDGPWGFEKVWPGDAAKFLAVDIYQRYGTTDAGLKWTPLDERFAIVAAFAAKVGVPWGLGETGVTDEAMRDNPQAMADLFAAARRNDCAELDYFSSALNSKGSWPLSGAKLDAFVAEATS